MFFLQIICFLPETLYFWGIQIYNGNEAMGKGKNSKRVAYSKREEERADKLVRGLFIGLVVLAVIILVGYAIYG